MITVNYYYYYKQTMNLLNKRLLTYKIIKIKKLETKIKYKLQ